MRLTQKRALEILAKISNHFHNVMPGQRVIKLVRAFALYGMRSYIHDKVGKRLPGVEDERLRLAVAFYSENGAEGAASVWDEYDRFRARQQRWRERVWQRQRAEGVSSLVPETVTFEGVSFEYQWPSDFLVVLEADYQVLQENIPRVLAWFIEQVERTDYSIFLYDDRTEKWVPSSRFQASAIANTGGMKWAQVWVGGQGRKLNLTLGRGAVDDPCAWFCAAGEVIRY